MNLPMYFWTTYVPVVVVFSMYFIMSSKLLQNSIPEKQLMLIVFIKIDNASLNQGQSYSGRNV